MNAPVTKDQINFSLGNVSYIDSSYEDAPAFVAPQPKHSVREWFHRQLHAVAEWRRRQETLREMEMLTDRELSDIGLNRSDLPRVFESSFAADRAQSRDYPG